MTDPGERLRSSLAADQSSAASSAGMADFDSPIAMEALRATRVLHAADQEPFPAPSRIRVITIANQKGGVGKTTSTVNLGVALALYGLRTLVIDLDPQGNASTALGVEHTVGTPSVYDALVGDSSLGEVVHPTTASPKLLCVPATIDLAGAEIELVSVVAREHRLRRSIEAYVARAPAGAAAALRADRLPAVPGSADAQRAGGRRRGAHPDPVRVLRARGPGAAALQHRPGARAPQPGHLGPDDPAHHVRRPDEARRPGRRRGPQPLRRAGAAGGHPPQRAGLGGAGLRPVGPHLRPGLARLDQLRRGGPPARRARRRPPAARPVGHGRACRGSPGRRADPRRRRGHPTQPSPGPASEHHRSSGERP